MRLSYTELILKNGLVVYLPLIIVGITIPQKKNVLTRALVDSGADRSLFDIEILENAGVDLRTCHKVTHHGAGGTTFTACEFPVDAMFPELDLNKNIQLMTSWCSMRDPVSNKKIGLNLLGRQDFFSHFKSVKFNEAGKYFELE